jgi:hypothetical protein
MLRRVNMTRPLRSVIIAKLAIRVAEIRSEERYTMKVSMALMAASIALLLTTQASAESVIANECPAVGDLAAQIAGWKNRGKTQAQAVAQTEKYYQDAADRRVLKNVVDEIYSDPRKKLVPEQVSVQITSQCAVWQQQAAKKP